MNRILTTLFLAIFAISSFCQSPKISLGARSTGIGGASSTLSDTWSIFNNPGASGAIDMSSVSVTYQNRYNLEAFQTVAATGILNTKWANLGIGFYRFGDELYSQHKISLSISHQLQMVSLGLNISRLQYYIEDLGNQSAFIIEFGGLVTLTEQILIAATVSNVSNAETSNKNPIPVAMTAGISFRPNSSFMLNADLEKDLHFDENLKLGLEYFIADWIAIRTGVSTSPLRGSFGFGIFPGKFLIDYAFLSREGLGDIHEISLGYQFP